MARQVLKAILGISIWLIPLFALGSVKRSKATVLRGVPYDHIANWSILVPPGGNCLTPYYFDLNGDGTDDSWLIDLNFVDPTDPTPYLTEDESGKSLLLVGIRKGNCPFIVHDYYSARVKIPGGPAAGIELGQCVYGCGKNEWKISFKDINRNLIPDRFLRSHWISSKGQHGDAECPFQGEVTGFFTHLTSTTALKVVRYRIKEGNPLTRLSQYDYYIEGADIVGATSDLASVPFLGSQLEKPDSVFNDSLVQEIGQPELCSHSLKQLTCGPTIQIEGTLINDDVSSHYYKIDFYGVNSTVNSSPLYLYAGAGERVTYNIEASTQSDTTAAILAYAQSETGNPLEGSMAVLIAVDNETPLAAHVDLNTALPDTTNFSQIALQPQSTIVFSPNLRLSNVGPIGFFIDSVTLDPGLNDGFLVTTHYTVPGTFVSQCSAYDFQVSFNSSGVDPNNAGVRSGLLNVYIRSISPPDNAVLSMEITVYVVSNLCLNRKIQIHSASNFTDVGSQGSVKDEIGMGMNDLAAGTDRFFDGGVFVANSELIAPNTVQGFPRRVSRQLYADQFLRCVADGVLDSTVGTSPTYYNLFVKSVGTDIDDTTLVWQNIWEQSTHPDSSDFLIQTTRIINVGSYPINMVAMGVLYDIDLQGGSVPPSFAEKNVGGDTTVTGPDGRFYRMGWVAGNDINIDTCSPNASFYGFIVIPGSIGNPSDTIGARGAVIYWQEGFGYQIDNNNVAGGDTLAQRYSWDLLGYHSPEDPADDTLTGVTTRCISGNAYRNDLGYLAIAKKAYNFPVNGGGQTVVGRFGLEGLAASMDTSFSGPGETYTVIHVGSVAGMADLIAHAQTAIDWYNNHTSLHVGSKITRLKGDLNDDGRLSPADVVIELNYIFLNADVYAGAGIPVCVADLNNTGDLSPADIVLLLNGTFLNSGCPYCLRVCI